MKGFPLSFVDFCYSTWPDRFYGPAFVATGLEVEANAGAGVKAGRYAIPIARGRGKTTTAMAMTIWLTHQNLRSCPILICASSFFAQSAKEQIMDMAETASIRYQRYIHPARTFSIRQSNWRGVYIESVRPDIAVIDDPEPTENNFKKLTEWVPALAGRGKTASAILLGNADLCRRLHEYGWEGSEQRVEADEPIYVPIAKE
jgi:hypothetical protein